MKINVAFIPARKNSKGVPGKNVRPLGGKPLIQWTIEQASDSGCFHKVVVTSDDPVVKRIAEDNECVYIERPPHLATDDSKMVSGLIDALNKFENQFCAVDNCVLLQPTAPFKSVADIRGAVRLFSSSEKDALMSVCKVDDCHPARMYQIDENNMTSPINADQEERRRQELDPVYLRNGAIYCVKASRLRSVKKIIFSQSLAFIMPRDRSLNIDDEYDFFLAEQIMAKKLSCG